MTPRSEEFMTEAHGRLEGARLALENGFGSQAVSSGYYAMLYAARAALSEEERYAKTHRGTWRLFSERFVLDGPFDPELVKAAERVRRLREGGDYDARAIAPEDAESVLADAERFVAAVDQLFPE